MWLLSPSHLGGWRGCFDVLGECHGPVCLLSDFLRCRPGVLVRGAHNEVQLNSANASAQLLLNAFPSPGLMIDSSLRSAEFRTKYRRERLPRPGVFSL